MTESTVDAGWLLEGDPAIRWQVMRDLQDAPEAEWQAERTRVADHGWVRQLLDLEDADGQWAGGSFVPAGFTPERWKAEGQPWTATCWVLTILRHCGFDPAHERAQRMVSLVGANSRWDYDNEPYWDGEVEECINGRTLADGTHFGVDLTPLLQRLLGERQPDGGWNCERAQGSTVSSFDTTINVLEGLREYERVRGGSPEIDAACASGEEFLLQRSLYRRLRDGEVADPNFVRLTYPYRWSHSVLRGLDYFRAADVRDERLADAIDVVRRGQQPDGRWLMAWDIPGARWFDFDDGEGQPSRWVTLIAARVLRWWDAA